MAKAETDFAGALADLNRSLQLDEKNAEAWYFRGTVKGLTNDYTGAIADLNQSLKLDPANAEAYSARGMAKFGANDYAGAQADLTQALDMHLSLKTADDARKALALIKMETQQKPPAPN
jgi:tetratricopeptide (TPR) repeat protein